MILRIGYLNSVSAVCQLNFVDGHKLFNFSLASPLPKFPHGVLSEDGFYKVAVNESVLWFEDCGGPLHYGMECSALVTDNIGGCSNTGSILWVVPLYLFMGRDGAGLVPWSSLSYVFLVAICWWVQSLEHVS
ncbi:uncharacterized protein LOC122724062 isoform X4 [Manihot esculenta]|uniref:uncharacterized protein LOC122724062 isoform X4 n=1 Tax=Manihot esculenta TaxID=3983 RepID=UPI001CC70B65|nr:uncharacterized protein LOC122724062 isoform X4 [Manihot esculenta]XP_043814418.1 uncharacterized protein LOC122724062 isoform X4 [Manihot esculenta]XP_043814419.1 uncharacterized protein LOC122724062 isoform X4 [Manihot esculenta]